MLKRYLRRRANNEFWIALCIALAIALVTVSLSSKSPFNQRPEIHSKQNSGESVKAQKNAGNAEPPIEATSQHNRHEGGNEASEYWTIFGHRLKITDSLLVVFAFTLWWATRALVFGAEGTAERQLRAYVFITDGGNISIDPTTFRVFIKLRNSGQTPGYKFSTWLGGGIYRGDDSPFPLDTKPLGERSVASIIGPGETVDIDSRNNSISQEEISAIIDEYLAIFVWGGCDYTDTFGKRWATIYLTDRRTCGMLYSIGASHV